MSDVSVLLREHVIPLDVAAHHIPGHPSRTSLNRYAKAGILETFLASGRRFTSAQACERAIQRMTDGRR